MEASTQISKAGLETRHCMAGLNSMRPVPKRVMCKESYECEA
jgi:hypothetical protein